MDLSEYAVDLAQNSIKAQAKKVDIIIEENINENYLALKVIDNGVGANKKKMEEFKNPFRNDNISLGIPMLEAACKLCNGELIISSDSIQGMCITATMEYNNIDTPPIGDIATSIGRLLIENPQTNIRYIHKFNDRHYIFDVDKIKGIMDESQLMEPSMLAWIKDTIIEGIQSIKA